MKVEELKGAISTEISYLKKGDVFFHEARRFIVDHEYKQVKPNTKRFLLTTNGQKFYFKCTEVYLIPKT